jgi:hypothetical protein
MNVCQTTMLCVPLYNVWTSEPIFTKFGVNALPLEDTPAASFLISYNQ